MLSAGLLAILEREPDFLRVLESMLDCFGSESSLLSEVLLEMSESEPDFLRVVALIVDFLVPRGELGVVFLVVAERVREKLWGLVAITLPDDSFVLTGDRCLTKVDCVLRLSELVVLAELIELVVLVRIGEVSAERGRDLERERGFVDELKSTTHEEVEDCSCELEMAFKRRPSLADSFDVRELTLLASSESKSLSNCDPGGVCLNSLCMGMWGPSTSPHHAGCPYSRLLVAILGVLDSPTCLRPSVRFGESGASSKTLSASISCTGRVGAAGKCTGLEGGGVDT